MNITGLKLLENKQKNLKVKIKTIKPLRPNLSTWPT